LFYFLSFEITGDRKTALIAAGLASVSIWIQVLSRHTHEVILVYILITLALLFFLKYLKKPKLHYFVLFSIFNGLALFTHHIGKLFAVFFFCWLALILSTKKL